MRRRAPEGEIIGPSIDRSNRSNRGGAPCRIWPAIRPDLPVGDDREGDRRADRWTGDDRDLEGSSDDRSGVPRLRHCCLGPKTAPGISRWLPGLATLREYRLSWLRNDIVAGIVLTTMLVPVGIAYAVASGLPGVYGLYATIVPLIAYAVFGPSRILVLGPDSSLAPIILAVVLAQSASDPARAVALAGAMAIVSGLVCILAGVLQARLHHRPSVQADPLRLHERHRSHGADQPAAQAARLLHRGSRTVAEPDRDRLRPCGPARPTGRPSPSVSAVLAIILLLKGSKLLPGVLIAVVGATIVVGAFDLAAHGVAVLGPLPQGLPAFSMPWIELDDLGPVLLGGAALALVSFADTSVLSRAYAARLGRPVNPNQEMVGLGAANLAAGLFQGFPISSSSSRTPVAEAAGARTQLTGVVGALGVAALLVAGPDLLRNLPTHRRSPRWSSRRRSACSKSPTCGASGAFSAGSSGCRSSAWPAWPCSAPFRASAWRWWLRSSSSCGTAGGRTRRSSVAPRASRAGTISPAIRTPA